jgi:NADH-quinone oxidoreductase subunit H
MRIGGIEKLDDIIFLLQVLIFPGLLFSIVLAFLYEWLDRKIYARLQNRVGPLYAGPAGILQPVADFIKLLAKEDIVPSAANKVIFNIAPIMALSLISTAVLLLPVTGVAGLISFDGDVILAMALMVLYVIVVFLAGFFSMNRFSTVGAERTVLQLLGYEIPMILSVMSVALSAGALSLAKIVENRNIWFIFGPHVISFFVYLIAGQAELERVPFDIPEAEQEIVAGWLTEYSGKKLALFRLSRDIELLFVAGLATTLFLGGAGPVISGIPSILQVAICTVFFTLKMAGVLFLLSTIRALFARLRIDQMVDLSWKYLIPISLLQIFLVRLMI